ncbi:MAG TPA: hypothetical protein VF860_01460 [Candidatus Acidoferrales bacterium]
MRFNSRRMMAGFSMVELIVVLAIAMIMTAISVPTVITQYRQYRLTSTAANLSSILQACRTDAIRFNTNVRCLYVAVPGGFTFWSDENNNGAVDPNEPQYLFPGDLQLNPGGTPAPGAGTSVPGAIAPATGAGAGIQFTPRGGVVPGGNSYILTLSYPAGVGLNAFRAVTVSPFGKTKVYAATAGSNWWNEL